MIPIAILCGGKGTRLGELTRNTPKSMVEVCGRPFIDWQLELLSRKGFKEVVLCIGHLSEGIVFPNKYKMNVMVSHDGIIPLGTGGALKNALPILGAEFMVTFGDSYLECDYDYLYREFIFSGCKGHIALYNGVPYGLGIFKASAFDGFGKCFDINELYETLALDKSLSCSFVFERFYEIGSPKGLEETCRHLRNRISMRRFNCLKKSTAMK